MKLRTNNFLKFILTNLTFYSIPLRLGLRNDGGKGKYERFLHHLEGAHGPTVLQTRICVVRLCATYSDCHICVEIHLNCSRSLARYTQPLKRAAYLTSAVQECCLIFLKSAWFSTSIHTESHPPSFSVHLPSSRGVVRGDVEPVSEPWCITWIRKRWLASRSMRISQCTRVGVKWMEVREQAAVMGVSKGGRHGVAHGGGGTQGQVEACWGVRTMAAGSVRSYRWWTETQ